MDQMNQGQNNNGNGEIPRVTIVIPPNGALYTASLVLGALSVLTAVIGTVYLPFILGGISIVLAILSRDGEGKMHFRARVGILAAVFGIILNIVIVSVSVYSVFHDPEQYAAFNSVFERVYGESFSDFLAESGRGSFFR